jgi:hypothetical protein
MASPAAIFLVMAFIALSSVKVRPVARFCNTEGISAAELEEQRKEQSCIPCPGRCRKGELVGCHPGYRLRGISSCELDLLFRNQVDVLKQDLVNEIILGQRAEGAVSVEEVRKRKTSLGAYEPKVFDIAIDEFLEENHLQVQDGVITKASPLTIDMGSSSAGGPSSSAIHLFLVFII